MRSLTTPEANLEAGLHQRRDSSGRELGGAASCGAPGGGGAKSTSQSSLLRRVQHSDGKHVKVK